MPTSVDIIQEDVESESGLEDTVVFRMARVERGAWLILPWGAATLGKAEPEPGVGGSEEAE